MAGDADVVRCASPWPGAAAELLEGLAALGEGEWPTDRVCAAAGSNMTPGDAVQVLCGLEVAGVCSRSQDGEYWSSELNRPELQRLVTLLRGAEQYRRLRHDAPQLELVVTMPMAPSYLSRELPDAAGRPGGYLPTAAALLRVAQAARSRIVVMTPFIDAYGFRWLRSVFDAAPLTSQKMLILREVGRYTVDLSVHHAEWLRAHNVTVMDYHLPHGMGRALPLETFHAKVVLADERLAYVGSANLLGSGDGTSLEAGVLVDGAAAAQVARLVDAIVRIARHI